jgi:molybdate transport system substrate-binding protein
MVASGGADAGIVYRTDAKGAKGVSVALEVPPEETPGIVYPAAALHDGPNPAGGKSFLEFASTPPAIWLFRDGGFALLTKP